MTGPFPSLVLTDGGRAAAGFKMLKSTKDCVPRAIAIAAGLPYAAVHAALSSLVPADKPIDKYGVPHKLWRAYCVGMGATWTPTMGIGTGATVHLNPKELPAGRLVCLVSKHAVAVIDGAVYDNHDSRKNGKRCVYGYITFTGRRDA